ncbi:hypothetical protein D9M68_739190 [compost metagenome]
MKNALHVVVQIADVRHARYAVVPAVVAAGDFHYAAVLPVVAGFPFAVAPVVVPVAAMSARYVPAIAGAPFAAVAFPGYALSVQVRLSFSPVQGNFRVPRAEVLPYSGFRYPFRILPAR